ncbi:MAG: hypothetical protein Q7T53_09985 [Deltaproteobacteria bacterium]|nr:hypothetical protein [Deltaproteobacteria bacterium]
MKLSTLFDPIEKLITEHGSAAIQEKHIALLREQLTILKDKFSVLEAENHTLKSENQNLETENKQLKKIIDAFHKIPPKKEYVCPRCHEPAFKLMKQLPHPNLFFANSGATVRLHRCEKCNYEETT